MNNQKPPETSIPIESALIIYDNVQFPATDSTEDTERLLLQPLEPFEPPQNQSREKGWLATIAPYLELGGKPGAVIQPHFKVLVCLLVLALPVSLLPLMVQSCGTISWGLKVPGISYSVTDQKADCPSQSE